MKVYVSAFCIILSGQHTFTDDIVSVVDVAEYSSGIDFFYLTSSFCTCLFLVSKRSIYLPVIIIVLGNFQIFEKKVTLLGKIILIF